jgi:hypothetical protein
MVDNVSVSSLENAGIKRADIENRYSIDKVNIVSKSLNMKDTRLHRGWIEDQKNRPLQHQLKNLEKESIRTGKNIELKNTTFKNAITDLNNLKNVPSHKQVRYADTLVSKYGLDVNTRDMNKDDLSKFIDTTNRSNIPTSKMVKYANLIANRNNTKIPQYAMNDSKKLYAWASQEYKKPSMKMIDIAKDTAKKYNLEIPKDSLKSFEATRAWVNLQLKSPTPEMVNFAKELFEKNRAYIDMKTFENKSDLKEWINKELNAPSAKMKNYALGLAKTNKIVLKSEQLNSKNQLSSFIDKYGGIIKQGDSFKDALNKLDEYKNDISFESTPGIMKDIYNLIGQAAEQKSILALDKLYSYDKELGSGSIDTKLESYKNAMDIKNYEVYKSFLEKYTSESQYLEKIDKTHGEHNKEEVAREQVKVFLSLNEIPGINDRHLNSTEQIEKLYLLELSDTVSNKYYDAVANRLDIDNTKDESKHELYMSKFENMLNDTENFRDDVESNFNSKSEYNYVESLVKNNEIYEAKEILQNNSQIDEIHKAELEIKIEHIEQLQSLNIKNDIDELIDKGEFSKALSMIDNCREILNDKHLDQLEEKYEIHINIYIEEKYDKGEDMKDIDKEIATENVEEKVDDHKLLQEQELEI